MRRTHSVIARGPWATRPPRLEPQLAKQDIHGVRSKSLAFTYFRNLDGALRKIRKSSAPRSGQGHSENVASESCAAPDRLGRAR